MTSRRRWVTRLNFFLRVTYDILHLDTLICIFSFQIKDITLDNAKLLLQIDNTKLANDDFKNK